MASPLPLALALAVATFTLAGLQLPWIGLAHWRDAGLVILAFAVHLQALSCVYGFLARDSAAGTGMALQAGGWLAIGATTYSSQAGQTSGALGLLLVGAATALLVPATTAALSKVLASVVGADGTAVLPDRGLRALGRGAMEGRGPESPGSCWLPWPCTRGSPSSWRTAAGPPCCPRSGGEQDARRSPGLSLTRYPEFTMRQESARSSEHRDQLSSRRRNAISCSSSLAAAATGMATSAPMMPSRLPPISTATRVRSGSQP